MFYLSTKLRNTKNFLGNEGHGQISRTSWEKSVEKQILFSRLDHQNIPEKNN